MHAEEPVEKEMQELVEKIQRNEYHNCQIGSIGIPYQASLSGSTPPRTWQSPHASNHNNNNNDSDDDHNWMMRVFSINSNGKDNGPGGGDGDGSENVGSTWE